MSIVAVHVGPPSAAEGLAARDRELLGIAATVGEPVPVVVGEAAPPASGWPASVSTVLHVPVAGAAAAASPSHATAALAAAVTSLRDEGGDVVAVLVPGDGWGREAAARLAVRLDAGVIAEAVELRLDEGAVLARTRPLGGTWDVEVAAVQGPAIVTVAAGARAPRAAVGAVAEADVRTLPAVDLTTTAPRVVASRVKVRSDRPDLGEASVVVAAGRGTDGDLSVVEELAAVLGGAVGVSRAVVEAGWAERDLQVGQTGRQVSPQLYLAAGISGAIQHRSGMQTSKTIIAINTDPEAPIFELADLGVVGDLFAVLPQLTKEIERRRGQS